MAFFKRKKISSTETPKSKDKDKDKKESESVVKEESTATSKPKADASLSTVTTAPVLLRPRVTEKATIQAERGVYIFEVSSAANKKSVADDVERIYKVTPVKVNIVKIPSKKVSSRVRGRVGIKSGGKKAYVHLKQGDRIEIV